MEHRPPDDASTSAADSRRLLDEAVTFLSGKIVRTPLLESAPLSDRIGRPVSLKLETLQVTGSFKVRGAWFRLAREGAPLAGRAAATCSAGNHGLGLAHAGRALGWRVRVYVPRDADARKIEKLHRLDAEVVRSAHAGFDATEAWARAEIEHAGDLYVSAYDDAAIALGGGGSIAAEILEDAPDVSDVVVPVGGGGLAAGVVLAASLRSSAVRVIGCEHADSPSLTRSLETGRAIREMPAVNTLADGLEGGLGAVPFSILRGRVHDVERLTEVHILDAVRWLACEHGLVAEPSAAASVATLLNGKRPWVSSGSGRIVAVLTGSNIAPNTLACVLRTSETE